MILEHNQNLVDSMLSQIDVLPLALLVRSETIFKDLFIVPDFIFKNRIEGAL